MTKTLPPSEESSPSSDQVNFHNLNAFSNWTEQKVWKIHTKPDKSQNHLFSGFFCKHSRKKEVIVFANGNGKCSSGRGKTFLQVEKFISEILKSSQRGKVVNSLFTFSGRIHVHRSNYAALGLILILGMGSYVTNKGVKEFEFGMMWWGTYVRFHFGKQEIEMKFYLGTNWGRESWKVLWLVWFMNNPYWNSRNVFRSFSTKTGEYHRINGGKL